MIRRLPALLTTIAAILTAAVSWPLQAQTQYRLKADPTSSLAWWQVNPHLNHLWATTCPQDPSWRPGEGRSLAAAAELLTLRSNTGYAAVKDTVVPLYPRRRVRHVCAEAVRAELTATDTVSWRGVRGAIAVKADALVTGLDMRDEFAKKSVLRAQSYPEILFTIDSLSPLQARGDTLRGQVFGVFQVLGRTRPIVAPVRAWHEGGGLRVQSQFMVPSKSLVEEFGVSRYALGLGAGLLIWEELHMGVDVVLVPAT
jgi:hypothetical protein